MNLQPNPPKVTKKTAGMHLHQYAEVWVSTTVGFQQLNIVKQPSEEFEAKCQAYADTHNILVIAARLGGNVEYRPNAPQPTATAKQLALLRRFESTNLPKNMTMGEASRRIRYWTQAAKANARSARHSRRNRYRITGG